MNERLGRWCFALTFVGFNATFLPMGFMGLEGMARRVYTYPPVGHLPLLNAIATAGASIMTLGVALLFLDILLSALRRAPAPNDPWGGYSLEWYTTSPPPEFNFDSLPDIRSRTPIWDLDAERRSVG